MRFTRHRFLLTICVIAIAMLAIIAIGRIVHITQAEARIAEVIEDLGGVAFFDEEVDAKPPSRLFPRLKAVAFYALSKVKDEDLLLLREISLLEELFLGHVPISDDGLLQIGQLSCLKGLELSSLPITDIGLQRLNGLSNLQWLTIRGCRVTSAGIRKLQQELPHCKIEYEKLSDDDI